MGRYESQWRRYRRLQLLSMLFLLPFCYIILGQYFHQMLDWPIPLASLMFLGFVGVAAWFLLNFFRCPRCGKLFSISWWFNLSAFAQQCVHCGLKKFGEEE